MSRSNQALKVAMAAAEQLPPRLRNELVEQLLAKAPAEERTLVLRLHRLPAPSQARLTDLMDQNNEGKLTAAEKRELRALGEDADRIMLRNSQALAQAMRPELFNAQGKPVKSRFRRI